MLLLAGYYGYFFLWVFVIYNFSIASHYNFAFSFYNFLITGREIIRSTCKCVGEAFPNSLYASTNFIVKYISNYKREKNVDGMHIYIHSRTLKKANPNSR